MSPALSPWGSRGLAVLLLLALVGGVYLLLVQPLWQRYAEATEEIDHNIQLINSHRALAASREALEGQLAMLSEQQAASGIYLRGTTDALAAAELQEFVNRTVESNGGKLRSIQTLPVTSESDFKQVGVRVQLTAPMAAFARILYEFEAGETLLFIDNLDVSNRQQRRRRNETDSGMMLLVRLDLSGYLRP